MAQVHAIKGPDGDAAGLLSSYVSDAAFNPHIQASIIPQ